MSDKATERRERMAARPFTVQSALPAFDAPAHAQSLTDAALARRVRLLAVDPLAVGGKFRKAILREAARRIVAVR